MSKSKVMEEKTNKQTTNLYLTELEVLEQAANRIIDKFNRLSGIKRSNSLLVLGQKFKRFEDRCIELSEERYVQALNPKTDKWVKIDADTAKIVAHKKSKGAFKGIRKL